MEPSFELKERDGCICGLTPELRGAGGVRLERIVRVVDTTPDKVENQPAYQTMQRELYDALCITKPAIDGRNAVDEKFY